METNTKKKTTKTKILRARGRKAIQDKTKPNKKVKQQQTNSKYKKRNKTKSKKRQRKTNKEMSLQELTILRKSDGLKAFLCASH
jgi:hypothetical protein